MSKTLKTIMVIYGRNRSLSLREKLRQIGCYLLRCNPNEEIILEGPNKGGTKRYGK